MNKDLTLIYYSFEPEAAKELAASYRKKKQSAQLRDAAVFNETEECDHVIIQEDVSEFYRDRLKEAYGDKVHGAKPAASVSEENLPVKMDTVASKRRRKAAA